MRLKEGYIEGFLYSGKCILSLFSFVHNEDVNLACNSKVPLRDLPSSLSVFQSTLLDQILDRISEQNLTIFSAYPISLSASSLVYRFLGEPDG